MPKNPDLEKVTLNLRRGDMEFIGSLARPRGLPASTVVREILMQWVDARRKLEAPSSMELPNEL